MKHDGLRAEVLAYFARNGEEELLTTDIATKFSCSVKHIGEVLAPLVREGYLISYRTNPPLPGRALTYAKGPKLKGHE